MRCRFFFHGLGFFVLLCCLTPAPVIAIDAVASIKYVSGVTEIQRGSTILPARNGLILYDQDIVITRQSARVTIVFRDGSLIRLFPNTQFLIEKSTEIQEGARQFINKILLKIGSFWGKFSRRSQETVINTPTATCGIKGTTVAFQQGDENLSVAVSSGSITVTNAMETALINAGQMVKEISKVSPIRKKIEPLPYILQIRPDRYRFTPPPPGEELELYFTLQMIDKTNGESVFQTGAVYVSHESDKIEFDPDIQLNARGYARIRARVSPFQEADYRDRNIEILVIMDGEGHLQVEGGRTVLTIDRPPQERKTIRIDAGSGSIQ